MHVKRPLRIHLWGVVLSILGFKINLSQTPFFSNSTIFQSKDTLFKYFPRTMKDVLDFTIINQRIAFLKPLNNFRAP